MKQILYSVLFLFIAATSYGQTSWTINFDNTYYSNRIVIDTISNPANTWRIGVPNKTVFTSANSYPNAIVTGLTNTYPVKDTASFTILHISSLGWKYDYSGGVNISGYYYVNSDSLTDYGYIDFSADHGQTWYRADSNNLLNCGGWATEVLPVFTGNSYGWKPFHYCLLMPDTIPLGDTILYRFTFVSDSIQTNKDGLMFDDLHFEDWAEGIHELQNNELISITPNPVSEQLNIHVSKVTDNNIRVQIFDYTGRLKTDKVNFKGGTIDVSQFVPGIYLLKYTTANAFAVKTFVVEH